MQLYSIYLDAHERHVNNAIRSNILRPVQETNMLQDNSWTVQLGCSMLQKQIWLLIDVGLGPSGFDHGPFWAVPICVEPNRVLQVFDFFLLLCNSFQLLIRFSKLVDLCVHQLDCLIFSKLNRSPNVLLSSVTASIFPVPIRVDPVTRHVFPWRRQPRLWVRPLQLQRRLQGCYCSRPLHICGCLHVGICPIGPHTASSTICPSKCNSCTVRSFGHYTYAALGGHMLHWMDTFGTFRCCSQCIRRRR